MNSYICKNKCELNIHQKYFSQILSQIFKINLKVAEDQIEERNRNREIIVQRKNLQDAFQSHFPCKICFLNIKTNQVISPLSGCAHQWFTTLTQAWRSEKAATDTQGSLKTRACLRGPPHGKSWLFREYSYVFLSKELQFSFPSEV